MADRPSVFLDTSVWIAAILSNRGASYVILERARYGEIVLFSSPDVFEEATRNLNVKYPKYLPVFVEAFERIHPYLLVPNKKAILHAATIVHPDDAPILAATMETEAEYLVTLDRKHFISRARIVRNKTGIKVLTPGTFLKVLEQ